VLFNSDIYYAGIGTANLQYQHRRRPMTVLQISCANTGIVDVTIKQHLYKFIVLQINLSRSNEKMFKTIWMSLLRVM
jgi:hypothetical protein